MTYKRLSPDQIAEILADLYQRIGQDDIREQLSDDEYVLYADALADVQYLLEDGK